MQNATWASIEMYLSGTYLASQEVPNGELRSLPICPHSSEAKAAEKWDTTTLCQLAGSGEVDM